MKSTLLGKESTSPVKVVNYSQKEESTKSVCLSLTGVDSHEALNVKFLKSFKLWENKNSVAH